MRLHALLMVRDEGDVIARSLDHLLEHFDAVYAFDTGSTDGTWEILESRASDEPRLELFAHEPVLFQAGLRALMFERYRDRFGKSDWVGRIDADEFFLVPPREFIASLRAHESVVITQNHDVLFERRDPFPPGKPPRAMPIVWPRRPGAQPYVFNPTYEVRLFRYRPSMRWAPDRWLPFNPGVAARRRLPVLHERWRSPEQAIRRWALRRANSPDMPIGGAHWARARAWYSAARKPSHPAVHWLEPGAMPTPVTDTRHLPGPIKRLGVRAFHACGLAGLRDRTRPALDPAFAPTPFPADRLRKAQRLERRALRQLARWRAKARRLESPTMPARPGAGAPGDSRVPRDPDDPHEPHAPRADATGSPFPVELPETPHGHSR